MIKCEQCGQEIQDKEIHFHSPDIYLSMYNFQTLLMRSIRFEDGSVKTEQLGFELPKKWLNYVLRTNGGPISISGVYRLPGAVYEWVLAKLRGDKEIIAFLEQKINEEAI